MFLALGSLLLAPRSSATELTDLGQGLGYLRVHALDEALKTLAGANPLVLDLRRATSTPEAITSFAAALSGHAAGSPLFVLVGPDTPAGLSGVLKGNLVTLGIKGSQPEPQVVVEQTAAADSAAGAALESGTTLAQLISGKIEKERFDEATLVHEFKSGNHDAKPPALPALSSTKSEGGSKVDGPEAGATPGKDAPAAPPAVSQAERLVDRVLQRAVHLHRALLALKHG